MSDCVKETASTCISCAYSEVCKHKENYLNEHYENDARTRYIPVVNVDCIGHIEVHCKYYLSASNVLSTSRKEKVNV